MHAGKLPKRFWAYLTTQSLGAFNDNFFKLLLQLYVLTIVLENIENELLEQVKFNFLATFVFTIPFVLFGPWSGYFADKYAKARVMKVVKVAEIFIMAAGVLAFYIGDVNLLIAILFLMATQSTFFSPSKYGYIPESCPPESVTAGNSWVEMTTFVSIILGTVVAGLLMFLHGDNQTTVSIYAVGFAVLGVVFAVMIREYPAAGSKEPFPWNPVSGVFKDLKFLKRHKGLFLAALANSYFWMIGLLFQTNILIYGEQMLAGDENKTMLLSLLPAFIGIGIAAGSMLASRWSGKKVELGLVPLGGFGMAICGILLYFTANAYTPTCVLLLLIGAFGGLYIVPLYAYLQYYAEENEKGRVMAAAGILNGLFMVLGILIYGLLGIVWELQPETIYLIIGVTTIFAVIYIGTVVPEYFIRFVFWLLTNTIYRVRIVGEDKIPFEGPALLTPNHVTYVDSFFVGSTMQRFVRFIMHVDFYKFPVLRKFFDLMKAIPIDPAAGRESVGATLERAAEELRQNHVVCIYPEGKLTRDGKLSEFRPGLESIMEGIDAPIIPVYMHNLWGSMFSYSGGKAILKRPRPWAKITICFGEHLPPTATAAEVEAAVRALAERFENKKNE